MLLSLSSPLAFREDQQVVFPSEKETPENSKSPCIFVMIGGGGAIIIDNQSMR
jgi:hypothetical protein